MSNALGRWTVAIDGKMLPEPSLIGGKAYSIARMLALGLDVPPAFVVTTPACAAYFEQGCMPQGLCEELARGIAWLETSSGRRFGAGPSPLLVSVRSGAAVSMPGMMDTVLNLGINDNAESALAAESGDPVFARDVHRRFYQMYAGIVLKATIPALATDGSPDAWRRAIADAVGQGLPETPEAQLEATVQAVFGSWHSRRAKRYRKHHDIPDGLGTAVTIQAMVFGNLDERSGTGVMFSRNPLTGDPLPYGEYLHRAQGEDIVSGKMTPRPLDDLREVAPEAYERLLRAAALLEREQGDVQDIEFTVQRGRLFLLQTRAAKRSPVAAVRFAVDMVAEGRIDEDTALGRVTAEQIRTLLSPRLADGEAQRAEVLASGEPACQGIGAGIVVADTDEAEQRAAKGEAVVLARPTTSPDDVHGIIASNALITEQGGATSHAAVVSRALGVPCVVGCGDGTVTALSGRMITVDGGAGKIYADRLNVVTPDERDDARLSALTDWAVARSVLTVVRRGGEEPAGILDLDRVSDGEDPARLPVLLAGHKAVKGGAIACDAGVRAALDAGVEVIVAEHVLPPLLTALGVCRT